MLPHFIISLKESTDRREYCKEEIKKLGYEEPNFFDAVRGADLSEEELTQVCLQPCFLTRGEIGCALSHLSIYRKIIEENMSFALILEDDFKVLPKDAKGIIPKIEAFAECYMAGEAVVLFLYRSKHCFREVGKISEELAVFEGMHGVGGCSYIITKEAAQKILELQNPLRWQIDAWKFAYLLQKVRLYSLNKGIIDVDYQMPSVIDSMETRNRKKDKRKGAIMRRKHFFSYIHEQDKKWHIYKGYLNYLWKRMDSFSPK